MKTIWKYRVSIFDRTIQTFQIPKGARLLSVDLDPAQPTTVISLWFEVDDTAETEDRTFVLLGTGHTVPDQGEFVGTVIQPPLAIHVYESHS